MNRNKVIAITVIGLFVIGVFTIAISVGDFFISNDYYATPLEAYNANAGFDAIDGDTTATKEMGVIMLDETTYLFFGEIDSDRFVVAEMDKKENEYASKGNLLIYNLDDESDGDSKNITSVSSGNKEWAVLYSEEEIQKLSNISALKEMSHSNGRKIYVVLY